MYKQKDLSQLYLKIKTYTNVAKTIVKQAFHNNNTFQIEKYKRRTKKKLKFL